eukprot:6479777-Amphidinium_carterae.1
MRSTDANKSPDKQTEARSLACSSIVAKTYPGVLLCNLTIRNYHMDLMKPLVDMVSFKLRFCGVVGILVGFFRLEGFTPTLRDKACDALSWTFSIFCAIHLGHHCIQHLSAERLFHTWSSAAWEQNNASPSDAT